MVRGGVCPDFPGEIAGASLKPALVRDPVFVAGLFPRRNRRGLIEASGGRAPIEDPTADFPGEIAGASLKPGEVGRGGQTEADFPGEIAGASLKPLQLRGPRAGCVLDFPGEIAGASLKPASCSTSTRRPARFPRRNRRGLIEA